MAFSGEDLKEFKVEASEILDAAEANFFALESGGDYRSVFDAIFRAFHNLKGASGMMELHSLQAHVHELETIFMKFKEKDSIPKDYISLFLRGIDGARTILSGTDIQFSFEVTENKGVEPALAAPPSGAPAEVTQASMPESTRPEATRIETSPSALAEFFAEAGEIIERISAQLRVIESKAYTAETINNLYRDVHSLKGAAQLFGFHDLGNIAHVMETEMEPVRDKALEPNKDLIDQFYLYLEALEANMKNILESSKASPLVPPTPVKEAIDHPGGVEIEQNSAKPVILPNPAQHSDKESEAGGSIRVPIPLLDNLMTLMGEMVLVRNQVIQFSNDSEDLEFLNLSKRLNLVTSEIQGEMMKTRMQPIGNVLSKYHRVVRDLSQELKKSINLQLSGSETELDKSLLEAIKDPLTHIVRNSCDHGIEIPEVRRKAGKSDQGNISIRSYHEGGQVVIEISDDGKGLHKDALIKKALEKGLITPTQVSGMSEKDTFGLIFAPGFSTAAVVTNVSGRGVGMDVVRTNIEKIGGTVELTSIQGKGTTTKIKIPLTLAIIPALIVKSGLETFAIPQVKLEELVRVDQAASENKIEYLHGSPVYRLRGSILPLVDLNQVLGMPSRRIENGSVNNIVVLSSDQCLFGLIVDDIQDTADIVVKPLNRLLRSLQIYSGATILGDGSIALILDIPGLAKVAHIDSGKESLSAQTPKKASSSDYQEYLLVRLNSSAKHAIVLGYVSRLEEFKRSSIEFSGKARVVRYGKTILPILSVNQLLGYGESEPKNEVLSVVVIQKGDALYGLEVDEIVDTLSTSAEVDSGLATQAGFFGNLNTPEGLIVAVDPFELIDLQYPKKVAQTPAGSTEALPHRVSRNMRPLKILFAEDTVFFRKAVTIILKKEGHEVTHAVDGREAYEILSQNPGKFDLIISDVEMPRMNGFEFAAAVRANPEFCKLPMLALSSRADRKYADLGMKAGFNFYLEKLKPAILLDTISQLSESDRMSA
jgi:two-component system chemotaxis sensor kinase CheA